MAENMETRLALAERNIRDHDDLLKSINNAVNKISESMAAIYLSLQKHDQKNEAVDRAFIAIEKIETKVDAISDQLPELKIYAGIVKAGILGTLGVVGLAILYLVVK